MHCCPLWRPQKLWFIINWLVRQMVGFPGGSDGKESACNAGDLGSIPGLGRSPGEGKGYPFQYYWAFLVSQMIKNPPAMWETWVWPLDWEDPLEWGMATHSSILAWRILMDRRVWRATVHGVTKSQTWQAVYVLWQGIHHDMFNWQSYIYEFKSRKDTDKH